MASNVHGVWRSTMDTDLVAYLRRAHVAPLVAALQEQFYIDAAIIHEAIRERRSFNVIHNETAQKVDVFVPKERPFDEAARRRVVLKPVSADGDYVVPVASPEDTILHKLEWYRMGGEVSERQWGDVLSVMAVKRESLDWTYLRRWATELGVSDLLERACSEGP